MVLLKLTIFAVVLSIGAVYLHSYLEDNAEVPKLPDNVNWGPQVSRKYDTKIRPFEINVSQETIEELKSHLSRRSRTVPPLEETEWTYGIPGTQIDRVVEYWKTKYDWSKRQALLNRYPQFVTNIQGLDVHFYHVKPSKEEAKKAKVLPLLMVHGWPGSVVEFQKIIPILTKARPDQKYVFELVVPSLPGYGFSEGARRPGLGSAQMGVIFNTLMTRLGYEQYYTQGGDWGSAVTSAMGAMYPDRVKGCHLNLCVVENGKSILYKLMASYLPSLIVDSAHVSKVYPLSEKYGFLMRESGYMHLQATKPDTIGNALSSSPVALATYVLEKFSTWTNPDYVNRKDGGLLEKYTMDELLDNVMVYWVTNSITTSMRLYAENFSKEYRALRVDEAPVNVPTACAAFPSELVYTPESLLKLRFKNLIQLNHLSRGGHFAAFEEPDLLARDIWTFVTKVETKETKEKPSVD